MPAALPCASPWLSCTTKLFHAWGTGMLAAAPARQQHGRTRAGGGRSPGGLPTSSTALSGRLASQWLAASSAARLLLSSASSSPLGHGRRRAQGVAKCSMGSAGALWCCEVGAPGCDNGTHAWCRHSGGAGAKGGQVLPASRRCAQRSTPRLRAQRCARPAALTRCGAAQSCPPGMAAQRCGSAWDLSRSRLRGFTDQKGPVAAIWHVTRNAQRGARPNPSTVGARPNPSTHLSPRKTQGASPLTRHRHAKQQLMGMRLHREHPAGQFVQADAERARLLHAQQLKTAAAEARGWGAVQGKKRAGSGARLRAVRDSEQAGSSAWWPRPGGDACGSLACASPSGVTAGWAGVTPRPGCRAGPSSFDFTRAGQPPLAPPYTAIRSNTPNLPLA